MKRILSRLTIIFSCICLSSCNFLKVDKLGESTIDTFLTDVYSLEAAVNGVYSLTYTLYDSYFLIYPEVAGDMVCSAPSNASWQEIYNFSSLESDETTAVGYIWRKGYEIMMNVNYILNYKDRLLASYPDMRDRMNSCFAQMYFIRALALFDLSLVYSQNYTYTDDASHLGMVVLDYVPKVDETLKRSSMYDTYTAIIRDLETALGLFPASHQFSPYMASPYACRALLARVYLYMGDYDKAFGYADGLIGEENLSLTPRESYLSMFNERKAGPEAILRLSGKYAGSNLYSMYFYQQPQIYPSGKLMSLFAATDEDGPDDIRKELLGYNDGTSEYTQVCMKYTDTEDIDDTEKHYDPFVLRLSEMYLIRAEAECHRGNLENAADDILELRARAYGVPKESLSLTYSGKEDLENIVMEERVKELFLEGHRLFDLMRRKEGLERDGETTSTVVSLEYPDDRFILPVPLTELDANTAIQPNPINSTQR